VLGHVALKVGSTSPGTARAIPPDRLGLYAGVGAAAGPACEYGMVLRRGRRVTFGLPHISGTTYSILCRGEKASQRRRPRPLFGRARNP